MEQPKKRREFFLRELVHVCNAENLPTLMGGDFNIIRSPKEKIDTMINDLSYLMLA
jgi:hypothetical protein